MRSLFTESPSIEIIFEEPIQQYLRSTSRYATNRQDPAPKVAIKTRTTTEIQNDPEPVDSVDNLELSPSLKLNRLAERYLWLRQANWPMLSREAWKIACVAHRNRTNFDLSEIKSFVSVCLRDPIFGVDEQTWDNRTSVVDPETLEKLRPLIELAALNRQQLLIVMEFVEFHWGGEYSDPDTDTDSSRLALAQFSGIWHGHTLPESKDNPWRQYWHYQPLDGSSCELVHDSGHITSITLEHDRLRLAERQTDVTAVVNSQRLANEQEMILNYIAEHGIGSALETWLAER